MASDSKNATTSESVEPLLVAEIELDLSKVRSRITDLSAQSLGIATDLLAVLSPLHQQVVDVIDLKRVDEQAASDSGVQETLALGQGDSVRLPAMLELSGQDNAA